MHHDISPRQRLLRLHAALEAAHWNLRRAQELEQQKRVLLQEAEPYRRGVAPRLRLHADNVRASD